MGQSYERFVKKNKVKVGRLLLLSHGAYSSYERTGWFVAVQNFSPDEMLAKYLQEQSAQKEQYKFQHEQFLAWLIKQAVLAEVEEFFDEWHMGDYHSVAEVSFMPRTNR